MNGSSETAAVEPRVATVVADVFGEHEAGIDRETEFVGDLGADAVEIVALLASLEREFGIAVPSSEIRERGTVGAAVDRVERELTGRGGD